MKPEEMKSKDPDMIGSYAALCRAAVRARELSIRTGTPFYIWRDGKVVDLNAEAEKEGKPREE